MLKKFHYLSLAGCLVACVAAALAEESPYGSQPYALSDIRPAAKSVWPNDRLSRITFAMEFDEGTCKDLVTAHEQAVRKLREALNDHDSSGKPTARAHLAAQTLAALNDREVIPFMVRNLDYGLGKVFFFTVEPVLEDYPYIMPLILHEERGARAIINVAANDRQDSITEREWKFYGYVLLYTFGDDKKGRNGAIAFIDEHDPDRTNDGLARLRESVRTVKRPLGR
jgi:hypothetical protein